MQFSIVIPTFNNLAELKGCLAALDTIKEVEFEVFVCVDGSTDGTLEYLEAASYGYPFRALTHPNRENRGRSATRNLALPHVRGKYTLFLDSDMEAAPDLFAQHLRVLESGDKVSIGCVHYRNRVKNMWVRYLSERGVAKFGAGAEVPHQYFITPNSALPTQWFTAVGGFDENISAYGGEDMEFGYRIHKEYTPVFIHNPAARVETTQGKPLDTALEQLTEYGSTGLRYIVHKHPDLKRIYWVHRCDSGRFRDNCFEFLLNRPFRKIVRFFVNITPFFIRKLLIHYLVIAAVHEGYRKGKD